MSRICLDNRCEGEYDRGMVVRCLTIAAVFLPQNSGREVAKHKHEK
jgi:hypothetical protein